MSGYTRRMSTAADAGTRPGGRIPRWTFADRMRKVRVDLLEMQQTELARHLGVTRAAYAAWESGRTTPRNILAIARQVEALSEVPAAWILGVDSPADPGPDNEPRTDLSAQSAL
ncbi:hypothetical protein GCM10009613_60670 [Pseudonocardia kongjuensis]|uniref:HTH cro/C1-type domain-containing protein n=1 Tax=Pseudonocardia kongjuensis TaxID=102227 RepID=A0ABP4IXN7_9PSEU